MHQAVREDRLWFQKHPAAMVRFRNAVPGEFMPLDAIGEHPPFFRPSISGANAPLHWVAVVDLMRLAGETDADQAEPTARLRLRIPAIRSKQRRQKAQEELLEAVAAELLNHLDHAPMTAAA